MILGDIGQSIALDSALILTVDSDGLYLIALLGGNAYRYAAPILDRHAAVGIGRTAVACGDEHCVSAAGFGRILIILWCRAFGNVLVI